MDGSESADAGYASVRGEFNVRLMGQNAMSDAVHVRSQLDNAHPQMLKAPSRVDPQKLGEQALREIGQALEWAIDQARTTKGALATDLAYTDQGVIGRWVSGRERVQLDKLKVYAPKVYVALLLALLEACEGVEVKTTVTMKRAG